MTDTNTPPAPAPAPATPSPGARTGAASHPAAASAPASPDGAASPPLASAATDADGSAPAGDGQPETFPREYVEKLRQENADARVRAKATDTLRSEVVRLVAASTNLMADPSDLTPTDDMFDADGKPDVGKVTEAVKALLKAKPHLGRAVFGDVGQGQRSTSATGGLSLGQVLAGVQRKG